MSRKSISFGRGLMILSCTMVLSLLGVPAIPGHAWQGKALGHDILWDLKLAPTKGHTGNVCVFTEGQLHEESYIAGATETKYHWHARDARTGALAGIGAPYDPNPKAAETPPTETGAPADVVQSTAMPPLEPSDEVLASWSRAIPKDIETALTQRDWKGLGETLLSVEEGVLSPIQRLLLGHAFLATNRNDDSISLFGSAFLPVERRAWDRWTQRLGPTAVAEYLRGDARARLQDWSGAIAAFDRALSIDENFALALNARGVCLALRNERDDREGARRDLVRATAIAPRLRDAHASLGTYALMFKAPLAALQAFGAAENTNDDQGRKMSPCAVVRCGLGCAKFGDGRWEESQKDLLSVLEIMPKYPVGEHLAFVLKAQAEVALADGREDGGMWAKVVKFGVDLKGWGAQTLGEGVKFAADFWSKKGRDFSSWARNAGNQLNQISAKFANQSVNLENKPGGLRVRKAYLAGEWPKPLFGLLYVPEKKPEAPRPASAPAQ